jgi:hypothetical protein
MIVEQATGIAVMGLLKLLDSQLLQALGFLLSIEISYFDVYSIVKCRIIKI